MTVAFLSLFQAQYKNLLMHAEMKQLQDKVTKWSFLHSMACPRVRFSSLTVVKNVVKRRSVTKKDTYSTLTLKVLSRLKKPFPDTLYSNFKNAESAPSLTDKCISFFWQIFLIALQPLFF